MNAPKNSIQICMLLNGAIANDSRVKRIVVSLSKQYFVHLFYVNGSDKDDQIFKNRQVKLYRAPLETTFKQKLIKATYFYSAYDILADKALQSGIKFEIVYANDLPTCKPAMRIQKACGSKFVYDSHEIYNETLNQSFVMGNNPIKNLLFKSFILFMKSVGSRFEQRVFKRLDLLITVNESIVEYFRKTYNYRSGEAISVMNCPLEEQLNTSRDLRQEFQWGKDDKILLYQGVLNDGRGLSLFMDCMAGLPTNYKWLILGDGILRKSLEAQKEKLGLKDRVHFAGKIPEEELSKYTLGADIGLNLLEPFNLSKALASPNKLFQYIHAKVPSICSDTAENKKVINQFKVGIITKNSQKDIINAVVNFGSLFTFDEKVFDLGKSHYSFANQEKKLLQNIEACLEK